MITVACPKCDVAEDVADEQVCKPCSHCNTLVFRPTSGPLVVVAYENAELRKTLGESLWTAGFNVVSPYTGEDVIGLITKFSPAAVAIDVGLIGISTHEVIAFVRASEKLRDIKLVLVASVYNKAAYKRRPSKLYGADDYIDSHQIDLLPRKIADMLNVPRTDVSVSGSVEVPVEPLHDLSARLRVRALAQSIVADIALYHNTEVEQAIRTGTVENLRGALDEGRRLLAEMSHVETLDAQDPVGAAFSAFLNDMRRVDK